MELTQRHKEEDVCNDGDDDAEEQKVGCLMGCHGWTIHIRALFIKIRGRRHPPRSLQKKRVE